MTDLEAIREIVAVTIDPAVHLPIACVGAGRIVDTGHLPGYERAGLPVAGIFDRDRQRARSVAAAHGIATVYDELDDVLADDRIAVIDLAISPWAQADVLRACLRAGKHVLCQKPFALDIATARELAGEAASRGVRLAVHQQLRFDEGIAVAREVMRRGLIGEPSALAFTVRVHTRLPPWRQLVADPRFDLVHASLHYIDAVRSFFGDPGHAWCTATRDPQGRIAGELRTVSCLLYDSGRLGLIHSFHDAPRGDTGGQVRLDGSEGSLELLLGMPQTTRGANPARLTLWRGEERVDYTASTSWLPDAFAGPMGSLLEAIATGKEPATSAADNLRTLEVVETLYRSQASGRVEAVSDA